MTTFADLLVEHSGELSDKDRKDGEPCYVRHN